MEDKLTSPPILAYPDFCSDSLFIVRTVVHEVFCLFFISPDERKLTDVPEYRVSSKYRIFTKIKSTTNF